MMMAEVAVAALVGPPSLSLLPLPSGSDDGSPCKAGGAPTGCAPPPLRCLPLAAAVTGSTGEARQNGRRRRRQQRKRQRQVAAAVATAAALVAATRPPLAAGCCRVSSAGNARQSCQCSYLFSAQTRYPSPPCRTASRTHPPSRPRHLTIHAVHVHPAPLPSPSPPPPLDRHSADSSLLPSSHVKAVMRCGGGGRYGCRAARPPAPPAGWPIRRPLPRWLRSPSLPSPRRWPCRAPGAVGRQVWAAETVAVAAAAAGGGAAAGARRRFVMLREMRRRDGRKRGEGAVACYRRYLGEGQVRHPRTRAEGGVC